MDAWKWTCCVALAMAGCGPAVDDGGVAGEAGGTMVDGDTTGDVAETDTDDDPPPPDAGSGAPEWSEDEQLCIDLCTNLQGSECGRADESCYTWCLLRIVEYVEPDCAEIEREVAACEAVNEIDAGCEATACEDVYRRSDYCRGWCGHLDGNPSSGGTQTECRWGSTCYGQEYEVLCPVGDAGPGPCRCLVDEEEIAQCEPAEPLAAFACGGEDEHVFTSCCKDAFAEVLLP